MVHTANKDCYSIASLDSAWSLLWGAGPAPASGIEHFLKFFHYAVALLLKRFIISMMNPIAEVTEDATLSDRQLYDLLKNAEERLRSLRELVTIEDHQAQVPFQTK